MRLAGEDDKARIYDTWKNYRDRLSDFYGNSITAGNDTVSDQSLGSNDAESGNSIESESAGVGSTKGSTKGRFFCAVEFVRPSFLT